MRQKFYHAAFKHSGDMIITGFKYEIFGREYSIGIMMARTGESYLSRYDWTPKQKPPSNKPTIEQIIDLLWKEKRKLLKQKPYPASIEQLLSFGNNAIRKLAKQQYEELQHG